MVSTTQKQALRVRKLPIKIVFAEDDVLRLKREGYAYQEMIYMLVEHNTNLRELEAEGAFLLLAEGFAVTERRCRKAVRRRVHNLGYWPRNWRPMMGNTVDMANE